MVGRQMLALGQKTNDHHPETQSQQQHRKHAGCGSSAERKPVHALQIARCPQGEYRNRHQRDSAHKILRTTNPFRHEGFDRPVARRITHRRLSPTLGFSPILLDRFDAAQTVLPSDFRQITPAKPRHPPASSSHSGLSRVAKASTADTAVTRAPIQVRSEVSAKIRPLAPINPIESGTSAAWMMAGQREWLDRVSRRLTQKATTPVGKHIHNVAARPPPNPAPG